MLKTVVAPEVASLSIGIFLLTVNIDYAIAGWVSDEIISALNLKTKTGTYGEVIFFLCAIPAALAVPFFYFAGIKSKSDDD